ncbi:MAG: hypothetical protein J0M15_16880 [Deltaproteobacteria bacterium]|nr:hypothetical protein [Deltaproteobacteria bacterium]
MVDLLIQGPQPAGEYLGEKAETAFKRPSLKKLAKQELDITDRYAAMRLLNESKKSNEILTGLFYIDSKSESLNDTLNMVDGSLAFLNEKELRPTKAQWNEILADFV